MCNSEFDKFYLAKPDPADDTTDDDDDTGSVT